jgi:predicted dehydrogenase
MEIVGTEGVLTIPTPFKPGRRCEVILRRGDEEQRIRITGEELYRGEVENLADVIHGHTTPRISLADSRANIAAILALLDSAERRQPVSL